LELEQCGVGELIDIPAPCASINFDEDTLPSINAVILKKSVGNMVVQVPMMLYFTFIKFVLVGTIKVTEEPDVVLLK
jgi:hypothetical protein